MSPTTARPHLKHETFTLPDVLRQLAGGRLKATIPSPMWTAEHNRMLLDSVLRGWPIGALIVHQHPEDQSGRVIDGQHRLAAVHAALTGRTQVPYALTADGAVTDRPGSRPAFPLAALLDTMKFLPARDQLTRRDDTEALTVATLADQAASTLTRYTLPVITVITDDDHTAEQIAQRLNP